MQKRGCSGDNKEGKARLGKKAIKAVRQVECIHHAHRIQHGDNIESAPAKKNCTTRQIKGRNNQRVGQIEEEPSCCRLDQKFLITAQPVVCVFDLFGPVIQKTGKETDSHKDHCSDVQPCQTRSSRCEEVGCCGSGNVEKQHQTT